MILSEPQLISPLLDGFVMGDPFSGHDGVRSCPAMHLETDKKYIVKIISVPASQSKLDALLLAGAFTDRDSALSYFKDLADGVVEEAELLQRLSKYEGFVSFESWQTVPMENEETGFDIYLLSDYRPTLENMLRSGEMTHLGAVNLGLDLCAALSVSRRSGYLYGNLRPSNIYICNEREYRIGDLGFISLSSLPYASLPDKYHSDYTPPEISDAYSSLNDTMDTYAVGLILYQIYNDGQLPPVGFALEAPRHADFELSEIILKACALNPQERWQDPVQMGQALVSYLQSHSVNDTPIVPSDEEAEQETTDEMAEDESTEPTTEDILAEVDQALEAAPPILTSEEAPAEEIAEGVESEEATPEALSYEDTAAETSIEEAEDAPAEDVQASNEEEEAAPTEEAEEAPVEESPEDETEQMLAQADDLIAHQLPDPVVAPEPIEVTLPIVEEEATAAPEAIEEETTEDNAENPAEEADEPQTEEQSEDTETIEQPVKKQRKGLTSLLISLAAVLVLLTAGVLFYQQYYLQTIHDIVLSGSEDRLSVTLVTDVSDDKLSVKCTDIYGNPQTQPVVDGIATFVNLKPGITYKLEVRIDGFHKLLGKTTQTYTTAKQTVISINDPAIGPEEGSVIFSFSVQYPQDMKPVQWNVRYSTADEAEKSITFVDNIVTLTGLTIGKEYTFTLEPVSELYITGDTTITYTPTNMVYAENLQILGFDNGRLELSWAAPEGATVAKWYVRCKNDAGYEKTVPTSENRIYLDGLDAQSDYTIEVTAEGMTLGIRTYLYANSISIDKIEADSSDRNHLNVNWTYRGAAPENGWLLLYTIDDSTEQQVVKCTENAATITPLIPGAKYSLTVQPADGGTIFGGTLEYQSPEASAFNGYLINATDISFSMCKTPNVSNWNRHDVKTYTTSFAVGESASFVMHAERKTQQVEEEVVTLYIIRDESGKLISNKYESRTWDGMWYDRYGKLTIPVMPENPGKYTVEIYFDGTAVTSQAFEIVPA